MKRRGRRVHGKAQRARKQLQALHDVFAKLHPQIQHWLDTGKVARGKIIHLSMPKLYAVVCGKVGRAVEFGLRWGIRRLRGGFVLGTVGLKRGEMTDHRYVTAAVKEHIALFGAPPRDYAYDRGGDSESAIDTLRAKGVRNVAIAPTGKRRWRVNKRVKRRMVRERAAVESSIGNAKRSRYGFDRPEARSEEMLGAYGHRALLGVNLNKLLVGLTGAHVWAAA